jgi:glutaredoxin 3
LEPKASYILAIKGELSVMPSVTIYTKGWCPYCSAAKKLLDDKGVDFTEIDIEKKPEARAEMIQKAKGRSTVPQIFIGEKHVGGCDDLYALDDRGQLEPLLQA